MNTFENFNLSNQLMTAINRFGFKEPTQIQQGTIPLVLQGQDVIGESATGSGKTLAFGAGIIERCDSNKGIQAIVLVPTRELAEQVKDEMIKISYNKTIRVLAVYGGVSINQQINELKRTNVVIATPGRLLDHLNRKTINMSKIKIFVLDEADRMIEMGFIEDVEKIIKSCPRDKQILLFSATMHEFAQKIARKYMHNPKIVHAKKTVDPTKLKQTYYNVPSNLKTELLVHLLKKETSNLAMVFCNTRRATDVVVRVLKSNGIKSSAIHGGLVQNKRLKIIDFFHQGKIQVLVCTDVAARGLNIEGITHIYNFDIPKEPNDYVHRIGRTARAGKEGVVINILAHRDYDSFSRLNETYRDFNIQKEERPFLKQNMRTDFSQKQNRFKKKKGYRGKNNGSFRKSFSRNSRNSSRNRFRRR